jgi:hypothetical protein
MTDSAQVRSDLTSAVSIIGTATAAKSGSTVTAIVNGITTTIQIARDLVVASGDVLLINKYGSQWVAVQRLFTAAPAATLNPGVPAVNPPTTSGYILVSPNETRSFRNGAWRTDDTDVRQGQYGGNGNHTGAVFYGTAPRSLSGATVTSATITVRRASGGAFGASATTMRLMTQATRPSGAPTLGATTAGPSIPVGTTLGAFAIPTSWAQNFVDATAGGIAFFAAGATPWVVFTGLGTYSPSFTLRINWTR